MSRATVELDFFGMDQQRDSSSSSSSSSKSQFQKFLHRQRSFRDIQTAISKINPEVLKSVIASGSASLPPTPTKSFSVPSSPKPDQSPFPPLPLYVPNGATVTFRPAASASDNLQETAPLTIFYNGTVSVFDVPRDKAESIMKLAFEGKPKAAAAESSAAMDPKLALDSTDQQQLLDSLNGNLPLARISSLQRFLEKRKERLNSVSPYACQA